jgi:hypothetical protein
LCSSAGSSSSIGRPSSTSMFSNGIALACAAESACSVSSVGEREPV